MTQMTQMKTDLNGYLYQVEKSSVIGCLMLAQFNGEQATRLLIF
jgi:hypothetical protein